MRFFSRVSRPVRPAAGSTISPEVLRKVQRLELRTRGFVESLFSGEYLSVFHGRGMEFSHVREYQVGDDVRAIDWKVTARRGEPFVRQFVEERDLLVMLVVDISASARFGPGARSAGDVAAEVAAALAFVASRNNDRVGLVLASDKVEHFLPPGSGRKHVIRLLAELCAARPRAVATDLTSAFERVSRSKGGRAVVFVVSDFIQDPASTELRAALSRAARSHDVIAVRLASPATLALPNVGWVEVTDPESGRRLLLDTGSRGARTRYARAMAESRVAMASLISEAGADLIEVDTTQDAMAPLSQFFRLRQRVRR